jgi:DNA polymerase-3 subunit alpha
LNDDLPQWAKENLGATLVATFGTETAKSCVLSAARGYRSDEYPNGIDVDEAQYLSGLIMVERGQVWSIHDMVYGNEEKKRKPQKKFITEIKKYDGLLEIMLGLEGVYKQRGSHASGVIFFDKDPFDHCAFMKTPKGEIITQFDLHQAEYLGGVKYDILVTDVCDSIVKTIELLQKDNVIDPKLSLKEAYDKYLHPDVLPISEEKYWTALNQHKVLNCFQFATQEGTKGIDKIQPHDLNCLSDVNGLIRLMGEDGEERPMDKYQRFKENPVLWYKEMKNYGLTETEQKELEPYFKPSYGVPISQEQMMLMLMDKNLCDFTLSEANNARKVVAKKKTDKVEELHQQVLTKAKSENLGRYIWKCGIGPQMG